MATLQSIMDYMQQAAPLQLAEEWDNVGLLVGRRGQTVDRLMTCLTITPENTAEAIQAKADLIVTHHPMPFVASRRITDETTPGRILLQLIEAGLAVYSAHTAFDSAPEGINQQLAACLGLREIATLVPNQDGGGTGRWGRLEKPTAMRTLAERLKQFLDINRIQVVGQPEREVRTVAIGCGAADELLGAAAAKGCDAMVLGEARFHTCLEAQASGIALLLPGHFASERFAMECLATALAKRFSDVSVWASRQERDPIGWL